MRALPAFLLRLFALAVLAGAAGPSPAAAAELRLMAPNAVKDAVVELIRRFETSSGHKVVATWGGSEAIAKSVSAGAPFDVVLTSRTSIDRFESEGKTAAAGRKDFSRSAIAAAAAKGVPAPDLSSKDALKAALLSAKSIAISSGASGRYLERLFQDLGVLDQIKGKIKQPAPGTQIGELLARGEAELGFQQVSELIHGSGYQYLGPISADVQNYTIWSCAIAANTEQAAAAQAFIAFLAAPAAHDAIRASGLEPLP